jgi:tetratricopeptide (TPR) repeat protein
MEKSSPEAQDHYYLAYAQRKLGNLDEAVNSLDAARASLRKSRDAPISVEDIDAQLAWCKLQLDAAQDAADLFQSVLVRTGEVWGW